MTAPWQRHARLAGRHIARSHFHAERAAELVQAPGATEVDFEHAIVLADLSAWYRQIADGNDAIARAAYPLRGEA